MAKKIDIEVVGIEKLTPDDKNFNLGTQYGQHLLEQSLNKFGAGRSILVDKNGRVIAGNKTLENAGAIGLNEVILVKTDGKKLVAVQRMDVDLDTKMGREMALADNVTSEKDLDYDYDLIKEVGDELNFNPEDWGFNINIDEANDVDQGGKGESKSESFNLIVKCNSEEEREKLMLKLEAKGYECSASL